MKTIRIFQLALEKAAEDLREAETLSKMVPDSEYLQEKCDTLYDEVTYLSNAIRMLELNGKG